MAKDDKEKKKKKKKDKEEQDLEQEQEQEDKKKGEVYKYSTVIIIFPIVFIMLLFIIQTQMDIFFPRYQLGLFLDLDNFRNGYVQQDQITYISACCMIYLAFIYTLFLGISKYRGFYMEVGRETITIQEDDILNIAKYEELYAIDIKRTFWGRIFGYNTIKISHKVFGDKFVYFIPTPRKMLKKINSLIQKRESAMVTMVAERDARIQRLNSLR